MNKAGCRNCSWCNFLQYSAQGICSQWPCRLGRWSLCSNKEGRQSDSRCCILQHPYQCETLISDEVAFPWDLIDDLPLGRFWWLKLLLVLQYAVPFNTEFYKAVWFYALFQSLQFLLFLAISVFWKFSPVIPMCLRMAEAFYFLALMRWFLACNQYIWFVVMIGLS